MATQASGADHWLTLNGVPLSFDPGQQNLEAQVKERTANYLRVTPQAPERLQISIDGEPLETEVYGRWIWFPKGFAGLYQLQVETPGHRPRAAQVRVHPSKHSYERYQAMLGDISKIATDLLFQIHSPASERLSLQQRGDRPAAIREYELVKRIVLEMRQVFPHIQRRPHRRLVTHREDRLIHEVPYFSADVQPVPGRVISLSRSHSVPVSWAPETWSTQRAIPSYDVYENRLLKHFLWRQLIPRIGHIQERARREARRREQERALKLARDWEDDETPTIEALNRVERTCDAMLQYCIQWGSEPFLSSVGVPDVSSAPTQVLQKHPYYNAFYRLYLRFQQDLRFSFDPDPYLHRISLRKLSELYEIWSVFRMTEVLLAILQQAGYQIVSSNGFFVLTDDQFHLELDRDAGIELRGKGRQIRIRYEPAYPVQQSVARGIVSTSGRFPLTPDLSLEVWLREEVETVLIFDAKYKWEEDNGAHAYLQDDLEKMYYYSRAIRWKTENPRMRPRSIVSSAYVLYPGDVLEHDPQYPEAGALPLVPNLDNPKATLSAIVGMLKHAELL